MKNVRFIGLDVHAETIAVAVAEPDGEVRSLGTIPAASTAVAQSPGAHPGEPGHDAQLDRALEALKQP